MRSGLAISRYSTLPNILPFPPDIELKDLPPGLMSALINCMVNPVGGSHCEKCFGLVHISNIRSRGAAKLRLITNCSLPDDVFSRYSASRSQVASPPAPLMNLRVCSAASGVGNAIRISYLVFPLCSENSTVTRKRGG